LKLGGCSDPAQLECRRPRSVSKKPAAAGELIAWRCALQATDHALDAVALAKMRLLQRILALPLDLGGMQERMPVIRQSPLLTPG
jgi:hypothetical protein